MEQADWLTDPADDDDGWAIDRDVARRVQQHAGKNCLMCQLEAWDDE